MRRLQSAQATVLFADLVGFTSFAENAPPELVAESIDAFLDLAVEAIFRAGGTLDKFIGDCVMAFFGAPVAQPDHALRAVRAAVEIQEGLAAWNVQRAAEGLPGFKARVALNSGPVVVGDIGSARRVDYTVLGNTVNVASRLEGAAPPGEVVHRSRDPPAARRRLSHRAVRRSPAQGVAAEDPGVPGGEGAGGNTD